MNCFAAHELFRRNRTTWPKFFLEIVSNKYFPAAAPPTLFPTLIFLNFPFSTRRLSDTSCPGTSRIDAKPRCSSTVNSVISEASIVNSWPFSSSLLITLELLFIIPTTRNVFCFILSEVYICRRWIEMLLTTWRYRHDVRIINANLLTSMLKACLHNGLCSLYS